MAKSKTNRAIRRKSAPASSLADGLNIELTQIRACIMSAVLAVEHKGVYDEVATMLRMSCLRSIERARALLEARS
jgi:hypothetical protein